ncbi:hypothetical protein Tco_1227177 [Tanacetum coccineum]
MSSSSSTLYRRYNRNQDVTHKTHCDCDPPHPIPVQTAWTLENADLPSDYYKWLLYDLHEENKDLKRINKMSGVIEDSSKRLPNYSNNHMYMLILSDFHISLSFDTGKLITMAYKLIDLNVSSSDTDEDMNEAPSVASVPKEGPSVASVPKEGPSVASVPKEGPSIRKRPYVRPELAKVFKAGPPPELLKWNEYSTVDKYLEDTYFDGTDNDTTDNSMMDTFLGSTNEDTTDNETTDKKITIGTTGKNLIFYEDTLEKYVLVGKSDSQKAIFKSLIPITGVVLGLANIQTWDDIVQKIKKRNTGNCADKGKGKNV